MKKTILIILALLPIAVFAQSFKEDTTFIPDPSAPNAKRFYIDTVSVSKNSKDQLYSNTLNYLSKVSEDSRNIIESKNLELGEIVFAGNLVTSVVKSDTNKKGKIISYKVRPSLSFKCNIFMKDKKFKVVLSNIKADETGLLGSGLYFYPFQTTGYFSQEHNRLYHAAINFVKNIAETLNSKPANDF